MGKFIDLTGKQIYDWTVIKYAGDKKWECRCSCGTVKLVSGADLRSGKSKGCGHGVNKFNDLTGQKFNEWTALEYVGDRTWRCRCSCGNIRDIRYSNLVNGLSKSCGCKQRIDINDIVGRRFGTLEVLAFDSKDSYGIKYKCKCDCGKTISVYRSNLLSGSTKSCGCNFYVNGAITRQNNGTTKGRSLSKIYITSTRDNFLSYILSFADKPTVTQLMNQLSLSQSGILWLLDKYDIKGFVDTTPTVSSYEDEIYEHIVSKYNIQVIRNNKSILNGKELDLYIPSKNLAIEFNGNYWHSDIFKDKKYHQIKYRLCAGKGIRLISIFEYEWKDDILKNKILNLIDRILDNTTNVVYARECELCEVSSAEANKLYNLYHLQNGINSQVNVALKYNDVIIGAMSFAKPRFSTKYEWEITRLCFDNSVNIVGGAERMFKHFIQSYKPKSIVSYCDTSKFVGNIYLRLGMKLDELCEPNYIWVDAHDNIMTRYQAQKHKLIELGIATDSDTEDSAMKRAGYMKIYNCGSIRFNWVNNN